MDTKKKLIIAGIAVVLLIAALFLFMFKDMSGMPFNEIEAYMEAHPNKIVYYSVTIEGGDSILKITNRDEAVTLTDCAQIAGMAEQAEYLQSWNV